MQPPTLYDGIGDDYRKVRRTDPRLAATIHEALGPATPVLNVGAGCGSYEPTASGVVGVEPSFTMIAQRPRGAAPVLRGLAERLPLADRSFAVAMAILTTHHWRDLERGLSELARVASRVVILTFDPWATREPFWLTRDYFPAFARLDEAQFAPLSRYSGVLGNLEVRRLEIPHDCRDGFLGAYWRRPEAYLEPSVRRGISSFRRFPSSAVDDGLQRLARDLETGAWDRSNGALRERESLDLGYRLLVAATRDPRESSLVRS